MSEAIAGTNITSLYKDVDALSGQKNSQDVAPKGKGFENLLHQKAYGTLDALHNAEAAVLLAAEGKIEEQKAAELMNEADIALQEFKAVWEKMLQAVNELSRVGM